MFTASNFIAALAAASFSGLGTAASTATTSAASTAYSLVQEYSGTAFFDGWTFQNITDPTDGFVDYVNIHQAQTEQLAGFIFNESASRTSAYMGVDHTTNVTTGRPSVRITSNATFSDGVLVIADVLHMPLGICGTWGALWMTGPDWPNGGEIDIIEGVNDNQYNSMTLHTSDGCTTNNASSSMIGTLSATNCSAYANDNSGCGVVAPATADLIFDNGTCEHSTAGIDFNAEGGGVYVMNQNESGINIYMFPHAYLPADISSGNPDPSSWTVKPLASFGGNQCDFMEKFSELALVINTDLCGSWGGEVWDDGSCPAKTGYSTCDAYVASNPDAFTDAYWNIASIKIYQTANGTNTNTTGTGSTKREEAGAGFPTINLRNRQSAGKSASQQNKAASGTLHRHQHR